METPNSLSQLYLEASNTIKHHGSPNAEKASQVLHDAAYQPLMKSPHSVPQCAQLQIAYQQTSSTLCSILKKLEPQLHWTDSGSGSKPKAIQERLAFTELVGPTGMVVNNTCRIGLFLQSQNTNYPDHHHAAEELYMVISGRALWSRESNPKPHEKVAGEFVQHTSWEAHAMHTSTEPLLAMWCWTGDVGFDQYEFV